MHPQAYPDLLAWIGQYGTDVGKQAVAQREAYPDHVAGWFAEMTAPVGAGAPTVGAAPARAGRVKWALVIGGAVAVLLAGALVLVLALPRAGGGGGQVRIVDLGSEPRETWTLESPLVGYEYGSYATPSVVQDRYFVIWDSGDKTAVSLINSRTGEVLWTQERDDLDSFNAQFLVAADGSTAVSEQDGTVTAISMSTGEVVAEVEDVTRASGRSGGKYIGWEHVALQIGDELGIYNLSNLDDPLWEVPVEDDSWTIGSSTVIVGEDVYAKADGRLLDWKASADSHYVPWGDNLYRADSDDFSRIDERDGTAVWTIERELAGFPIGVDTAIFHEADGGISGWDLDSGKEKWSRNGEYDESYAYVFADEARVVFFGSDEELNALDLDTGETLYRIESTPEVGRSVGYVWDVESVQAFDLRTGESRWSREGNHRLWGGNLVEVRGDAPSGEPQIIGLRN